MATMLDIAWNEPATLIDLDGKTPLIGTIGECVQHFTLFMPSAQMQARILLTRPVFREGGKSRTWILEPAEIAMLAARMAGEGPLLH